MVISIVQENNLVESVSKLHEFTPLIHQKLETDLYSLRERFVFRAREDTPCYNQSYIATSFEAPPSHDQAYMATSFEVPPSHDQAYMATSFDVPPSHNQAYMTTSFEAPLFYNQACMSTFLQAPPSHNQANIATSFEALPSHNQFQKASFFNNTNLQLINKKLVDMDLKSIIESIDNEYANDINVANDYLVLEAIGDKMTFEVDDYLDLEASSDDNPKLEDGWDFMLQELKEMII